MKSDPGRYIDDSGGTMELFKKINKVKEEQMHPKYRFIKDNLVGKGEREILQAWVDGLVDRDNKMIEEFQRSFHSCFWEFYLYACFIEAGFDLNQQHNRPDFIIEAPHKFYVEAVVSNIKNHGRPETDRNLNDLMDMFIPPNNQEDFYEILDEAIVRQANAISVKVKKYREEYLKCDWIENNIPFVIALSSYSQVNYGREFIYPMMALLYGMYYRKETDTYEKRRDIIKPGTDSTINIGLFCGEEFRDISAVLYSSTTTIGKLTSLAISNGYQSTNTVYNLRKDYQDSKIPYKLQKVSMECPELLSDGLFLFHNPFAKNKLNTEWFESTNITQFFWENGTLFNTSNTYPIVCRLNIPKVIEPQYRVLIDEYVRQYNGFSPIEAYSILPVEKIDCDFEKDCLVCIWIAMKDTGALRNLHYCRPQFWLDSAIYSEALQIVKTYEEIGKMVRIDIVRTSEQLSGVNQ